MKKRYKFSYHDSDAFACFNVDTDIFTEAMANATLDYYSWHYDHGNNPIDEVLRKYAIEAIKMITRYGYTLQGVIRDFEDKEGFARIDGSMGITLTVIRGYEFDEDLLFMDVSEE